MHHLLLAVINDILLFSQCTVVHKIYEQHQLPLCSIICIIGYLTDYQATVMWHINTSFKEFLSWSPDINIRTINWGDFRERGHFGQFFSISVLSLYEEFLNELDCEVQLPIFMTVLPHSWCRDNTEMLKNCPKLPQLMVCNTTDHHLLIHNLSPLHGLDEEKVQITEKTNGWYHLSTWVT